MTTFDLRIQKHTQLKLLCRTLVYSDLNRRNNERSKGSEASTLVLLRTLQWTTQMALGTDLYVSMEYSLMEARVNDRQTMGLEQHQKCLG